VNRFTWTDHAQAELRRIEQQQALEILHALTRNTAAKLTVNSRAAVPISNSPQRRRGHRVKCLSLRLCVSVVKTLAGVYKI
jgi:hypothetical protein